MSEAFDGATVAVSVDVAPTVRASVLLDMLMPVTGTRTVTVQVAFWPPDVVAVIVAVPGPTAVTLPPETVATEAFEVVQVTVLLVAFVGCERGGAARVEGKRGLVEGYAGGSYGSAAVVDEDGTVGGRGVERASSTTNGGGNRCGWCYNWVIVIC